MWFQTTAVIKSGIGTQGEISRLLNCFNPPTPQPLVVYSTDRSKAVAPVFVLLFVVLWFWSSLAVGVLWVPVVCSAGRSLLFVALWFILRGVLFYVLPFVILFLYFSVLLALRLPRLGKRELILVLFVRLFVLCLFGFVGFLFLLVYGRGCGLWLWHFLVFSLTFF